MNLAQMITITKLMSVHEIVSIDEGLRTGVLNVWIRDGDFFIIYLDGVITGPIVRSAACKALQIMVQ